MELDQTTYRDLSIFHHEEEFSIFSRLNFTQTNGGKQELKNIFLHPLKDSASITAMQQVVRFIHAREAQWPSAITNGTVIMIEEYLGSKVEIASGAKGFSAVFSLALYKTTKGGDFAFICYSLSHVADFFQGCRELVALLLNEDTPSLLRDKLLRLQHLSLAPEYDEIIATDFRKQVSVFKAMRLDHFIRRMFRHRIREMIELYHLLDAWHAMALAVRKYNLVFPEFTDHAQPYLHAEGLYHILLHEAVDNTVLLDRERNFLFLTGANMAGKSTFIKAIGIAVFLAHIGMGVPARSMQLTEFHGVLTNIQVEDNVFFGESYFYNEVQRIKNTIIRVKDHKHWLILIDELFKGTNIEDAKNCSVAVIKGLSKINDSLFILSTHLYEIAVTLKDHPNIIFQYFETEMQDGVFTFNYHLRNGISNDRLGYLILQREKVIELLEEI